MIVTIDIPDSQATGLVAAAASQGVSATQFVRQLVDDRFADSVPPKGTPMEINEFFRAMAAGSENLPQLTTESFSRASYYADRG